MHVNIGYFNTALWQNIRALPFSLTLLLLSLALGLASGMSSPDLTKLVAEGFGASLGEIALILLPSFVLAGALSHVKSAGSGGIATLMAPFAGAGMVCPDTAYAAISPIALDRKLSVLFGSYAGFKLLVPAGPAIIATTLGGLTPTLVSWGVIAFIPCWVVGLLFASRYENGKAATSGCQIGHISPAIGFSLATLVLLICAGGVAQWKNVSLVPWLEFLSSPSGALIVAALISLFFVDLKGRVNAFNSGTRRTAELLLMIGAASALGMVLVSVLPFEQFAKSLVATGMVIPALFLLTALFKTAKGSSMATFAGTSGIVSALLPSLNVSPEAATLALCAGAFVTIAPNDSLYWLVRENAFTEKEGFKATRVLGLGAVLQGITALLVVQVAVWSGQL